MKLASVVIPLAQFAKVGVYWANYMFFIFNILRNTDPRVSSSYNIWPFILMIFFEFISGLYALVKSDFSRLVILFTSIFPIVYSFPYYFYSPILGLVALSITIAELFVLNDKRIRRLCKVNQSNSEW